MLLSTSFTRRALVRSVSQALSKPYGSPLVFFRAHNSSFSISCDNDTGRFKVQAPWQPAGDQGKAIQQIQQSFEEMNEKCVILQGATGTGKTFVMSHVIEQLQKPTLILCHNKSLAAQLARELRSFLPHNAVELFVSYYNFYIPETYIPNDSIYTSKRTSINSELDLLRHRCTRALLERRDVVVVSSVSCIYGLGLPAAYCEARTALTVGDAYRPSELREILLQLLYEEQGIKERERLSELERGQFRFLDSNHMDCLLQIWPVAEVSPIEVNVCQSTIISLKTASHQSNSHMNKQKNHASNSQRTYTLYPARLHMTPHDVIHRACLSIKEELEQQKSKLIMDGKEECAARLSHRVENDLQLLRESGFCSGLENYSRHFSGRPSGSPPDTLLDYFSFDFQRCDTHDTHSQKKEWLMIVDESHMTLPQLSSMHAADQARKKTLVDHGFRLPSALDNRPLSYNEVWERVNQCLLVSATPGKAEKELRGRQNHAQGENQKVEMQIRPTAVLDPPILVRPSKDQLDDLLKEVTSRALMKDRSLVMCTRKRDAEDLAAYLIDHDVKASFIHSDLNTQERATLLRALQCGKLDCLVGVNLLREGIDLPEVSLVAVINADKSGFLRSEAALIQMIGRASRNVRGTAILYADRITPAMQSCIMITEKRRQVQSLHNITHQLQPRSTHGSHVMSLFDLAKEEGSTQRAEEAREALKTCFQPSTDATHHSAVVEKPIGKIQGDLALETKDSSKRENLLSIVNTFPDTPGVYLWKDGQDILYIGKAKNIRKRVKSYFNRSLAGKQRTLIRLAGSIEYICTCTEEEALLLELRLIQKHHPRYNVLLRDDTPYPFYCASVGDDFPRFFVVNRKFSAFEDGIDRRHYLYFGPITSPQEVEAIHQEIEKKYGLRRLSFLARFGEWDAVANEKKKREYQAMFRRCLSHVFGIEVRTREIPSKSTTQEIAWSSLFAEKLCS